MFSRSKANYFKGSSTSSGFRTAQGGPGGAQLQREFDTFMNGSETRNAGQNFNMAPEFLAHQHQSTNHIPQVHISSKSSMGVPVEGWASDFSNMHISQQQRQQQQGSSQGSSQGWHEQFLKNNTAVTNVPMNYPGSQSSMYNVDPMMQMPVLSSAPQQSAIATSTNEAKLFEAAFSNIQQQIDTQAVAEVVDVKEVMDEAPQDEHEQVTDENSELSKIANHIVNNIDRKNEKLKSSNFMMLMQQLSEKQVRLEGDKFVDEMGVDVRDSQLANSVSSPRMDATAPDIPGVSSIEPSTESRLPDPFEFFDQEKKDAMGDKIYSPFELAQMLAPKGVPHPSSWEEKYNEYF